MKINKLYLTVIIVCFITILLLAITNNKLKELNNILLQTNLNHYDVKEITKLRIAELKSASVFISDSLEMIDESDSSIRIKDVINTHKTLVYRYSDLQCKMCVESQLEIMDSILGKTGYNIIFVANYKQKRDLIVFKKLHKISYPIYCIKENNLSLAADTLNIPYYFILNNYLETENVFISKKEYPEFSVNYLNAIKKTISK